MNSPADALHPLIEVTEFIATEASRSRVAVVFDLDSTLFCVSPRTQFILRSLGADAAFAAQHAELARYLVDVEVLPDDYSVRTIVGRARLQPTPEMIEAVRTHWHHHFFSSTHLHRDVLYPSAAEYVRQLRTLGAEVLYLTGRGEGRMREGTVKALREHGFPFDEAKLLMKPSEVLSDEGFKTNALRGLVTHYDHVWFFENEPVIIADVRKWLPAVRIVFVKSAHSGKGVEPIDVRTILPDYGIGVK